jgi:hypothetical protein
VITSYLPPITEVRLLGVFDPGVPNMERVVLKVEANIDIGWYAIILSQRGQIRDHATPIKDCMYWFGSGSVAPNDFFFLYTGSGTRSTLPPDGGHGKLFIEFWGKKETIFHNAQIVPVLWRLNGIVVERTTTPQQLPMLTK